MDWKIIKTEPLEALEVMQKDRDLLDSIDVDGKPILHLYEWKYPSITYGHFLDPKKFFSSEIVEKEGISIAKRPTGGGIIFHLWDCAFSALIPASHPAFSQNTLENYAYINSAVLDAVQEFLQMETGLELTPQDGSLMGSGSEFFCMAKPTRYDVMIDGKKVAGAAQRRTKKGLLHQGSISLMPPCKKLVETILQPQFSVMQAMDFFTFPLLGFEAKQQDLIEAKKRLKELLKKHLLMKKG